MAKTEIVTSKGNSKASAGNKRSKTQSSETKDKSAELSKTKSAQTKIKTSKNSTGRDELDIRSTKIKTSKNSTGGDELDIRSSWDWLHQICIKWVKDGESTLTPIELASQIIHLAKSFNGLDPSNADDKRKMQNALFNQLKNSIPRNYDFVGIFTDLIHHKGWLENPSLVAHVNNLAKDLSEGEAAGGSHSNMDMERKPQAKIKDPKVKVKQEIEKGEVMKNTKKERKTGAGNTHKINVCKTDDQNGQGVMRNTKNEKKQLQPKNDDLILIYLTISCGGKENQMPILTNRLIKYTDEKAAQNLITTWLDQKSKNVKQYIVWNEEIILDVQQTFREILSEFKRKAEKRKTPYVLLLEERNLVLYYLGLFCDCSTYTNSFIKHILLSENGHFRPILLKLPTEVRWLWLWTFLNAWISVACLLAREQLIEEHLFRHILLHGALFSVQKYFKTQMDNILLFPKGLRTIHDGTIAFVSHALSLGSVGKSHAHKNVNWREIYDAPTDRSDLLVEELQRHVKESGNRARSVVVKGDKVCKNSTQKQGSDFNMKGAGKKGKHGQNDNNLAMHLDAEKLETEHICPQNDVNAKDKKNMATGSPIQSIALNFMTCPRAKKETAKDVKTVAKSREASSEIKETAAKRGAKSAKRESKSAKRGAKSITIENASKKAKTETIKKETAAKRGANQVIKKETTKTVRRTSPRKHTQINYVK
jgi:hypothetical protein